MISRAQSINCTPSLTKNDRYSYLLCGWQTQSDIPLACVPSIERGSNDFEVIIQEMTDGPPLPENSSPIVFQHSGQLSRIRVKSIAQFEVSNGRQIRVWPAAGAAQKDIQIFLLGPAWAALCHQRGLLPLHASAVRSKEGIVAFAGDPGAGKSTTAAIMGLLGYEILADDIVPVSFDKHSRPGAWPYLRRLKLKGDTVSNLELQPTETVSETLDTEKVFVRLSALNHDKWMRLRRIYLLENDSTASGVTVERLTGADALAVLIRQTYHHQFIVTRQQYREHLARCVLIASNVSIYRLRRSLSGGISLECRRVLRNLLD